MKNATKNIFSSILLFGSVLSANSAMASEKPAAGSMTNLMNVEIPGVVVPIASGKRLVNYCFLTIIVYAGDDRSATTIRANQLMVKDAISRYTSKNPVAVLPQANTFDGPSFARAIVPVVASTFPGLRVNRIEVQNPQMMRH